MKVSNSLRWAALVALAGPVPGLAQEARPASGFYAGGHVGYLFGTATATLADTAGGTSAYGTISGGAYVGYEHHFAAGWMAGLELDMTFPGAQDLGNVLAYRATGSGAANEQLEYLATVRGRCPSRRSPGG